MSHILQDENDPWSFRPEAVAAAEGGARKASRAYPHDLPLGDATQEALLLLYDKRARCEAAVQAGGYRRLASTVWSILTSRVIYRHSSWWNHEQLPEEGEGGAMVPKITPRGATYDTATIEAALDAIWDSSRFLPGIRPTSPDPDMPKGSAPDPSHSGTTWVVMADVHRAWKRLPSRGRRATFLHHSLGMTFRDMAGLIDGSPATLYRDHRDAIEEIRDRLNGTYVGPVPIANIVQIDPPRRSAGEVEQAA